MLGQYAGRYRRIPSILFEHDIYFQSIARRLPFMTQHDREDAGSLGISARPALRAAHAPEPDRIQVCSQDNADYLASFLPAARRPHRRRYRAGIDTSLYDFKTGGREPFTMLFLGSFRHLPNQEALDWFVRKVLPQIRAKEPRARLIVIGSDPPPRHSLPEADGDRADRLRRRRSRAARALLRCSSVPILSGSGVRVKLLEAFAAGIPVVSTRLGAEGLATMDGEICALADDPAGFRGARRGIARRSGKGRGDGGAGARRSGRQAATCAS